VEKTSGTPAKNASLNAHSGVSLERLAREGFIFHRYDAGRLLSGPEGAWGEALSAYISGLLAVPGETLSFDWDELRQGQEILPHFHVIPGSFQVVVWLPDAPFDGRDFLFGRPDRVLRVHPERGWMCFMKPNDPALVHGVSRLESARPVRTLGFSSLFQPFSSGSRNDVFVPGCRIETEVGSLESLL
jgi:hypothetical protein